MVIGGGTGCPAVLRALLPYHVALTAIVTTFDNGGSTGNLRAELGIPAVGDLRRALGALASPEGSRAELAAVLEHRFAEGGLAGHTLGNLLLAALCEEQGGIAGAVEAASRMLAVRGVIIPVSLEFAHLWALMADGERIVGEDKIDHLLPGSPPIREVFLEPRAAANPAALAAIRQADWVVLGPGDLYTSVLPNLLAQGVSEALRATRARKAYVCNLTNRPGQTQGFTVSRYAAEVLRYTRLEALDALLAGSPTPNRSEAGVPFDGEACSGLARMVVTCPLTAADGKTHDAKALGKALAGIIGVKRPT